MTYYAFFKTISSMNVYQRLNIIFEKLLIHLTRPQCVCSAFCSGGCGRCGFDHGTSLGAIYVFIYRKKSIIPLTQALIRNRRQCRYICLKDIYLLYCYNMLNTRILCIITYIYSYILYQYINTVVAVTHFQ